MKRFYFAIVAALSVWNGLVAQPGTAGEPFYSLSQARTVTVAGTYYFNLSGVTFSSYVDANGYLMIATDFGNGLGTLPATTALNTSSRGILPPAVLAVLTEMNQVRISTSVSGSLDAVSSDPEYITRVTNNVTLMNGTADNAYNNGWTGTGAATYMLVDAVTTRPHVTLAQEIFHTHGDATGLHWFPERGDQGLGYTNEIAASENMRLWVRAADAPAGSAINPFLSLVEATTVPAAGIYFFNLNGVAFSTYVDAEGFVQIAFEFGSDAAAALPQGTSLDRSTRGILTPAALASLTEMTEVRISSSELSLLDARTTNVGVFNKVLTNDAIKADYFDDAINADWTGTGSNYLTAPGGAPNTNGDRPLHEEIFHNYYNTDALHWIPYRGDQALTYTNNVSATESYTLWVRASPAALPLRLDAFGATNNQDGVRLEWAIEAPDGGEYIDLERSADGREFQTIYRQQLDPTDRFVGYVHTDRDAPAGINYYRLRQRDYDGTLTYSEVLAVRRRQPEPSAPRAYPNPTRGEVTVLGTDGPPTIRDARGRSVLLAPPARALADGKYQLDLTGLKPGIYFVSAGREAIRLVKY